MSKRSAKAETIHIAISETPLAAGITQRALCGAEIFRAAWLWTTVTPGSAGSQRVKEFFAHVHAMCPECWLADWGSEPYVYALVPGEAEKK